MGKRRTRRGRVAAFLAAVLFSAATGSSEEREIFALADPRGDDKGSGAIVYPLRDDLRPGDLDLVRLSARPDPGGTMFEATFAKPIAQPGPRTIDVGGGQLSDVARLGFYTFNLEIYVDTDRIAGSGAVSTLPGRKAEIDPANAWEKAICLTPRPNEARDQLKRILTRFAREDLKAHGEKPDATRMKTLGQEIRLDVENRVFFPTRVHVFGPTVRFLVPTSFLGGPAKPSWSYVVAVSGAQLFPKLDVAGGLKLAEPEPDNLMIVPVAPGRWSDRFGGGEDDDPLEPPLLDIVVPKGKTQKEVLEDRDPAAKRPVRLPGVVPSEVKVVGERGTARSPAAFVAIATGAGRRRSSGAAA